MCGRGIGRRLFKSQHLQTHLSQQQRMTRTAPGFPRGNPSCTQVVKGVRISQQGRDRICL